MIVITGRDLNLILAETPIPLCRLSSCSPEYSEIVKEKFNIKEFPKGTKLLKEHGSNGFSSGLFAVELETNKTQYESFLKSMKSSSKEKLTSSNVRAGLLFEPSFTIEKSVEVFEYEHPKYWLLSFYSSTEGKLFLYVNTAK